MFEKHNNVFILESQGVGKYGRCLGNIFFGDQNLNDLLITEGHAVAYHGGKR
jgi:endonuclease YncB( thermonuclease family)